MPPALPYSRAVDLTVVFNVSTLVVSVIALVASAVVGVRQIRLSNGGNQLPVVLEAFRESREPGWLPANEYVLNALRKQSPEHGQRGLPDDARVHTTTIGLFYDDLGKLVAHGVIGKDLVIGAYGTMIVRLWDALAPFVYAERRLHGLHFWIYFENLAALTAQTDMDRVYRKLRARPPRPTPVEP
jgi:hypothetical protein